MAVTASQPHAAPAPATARRAGLDRDEVVDAALALVEADGPEGLSMRKLAAQLGVTTTTIYWHVGSREELVTAVIRRLSERLADRRVVGSTPEERVMSAVGHVWQSALEHRHVTSLAHQSGATSLLELPLEVAVVRELEAAGLTGGQARDALRAILMCVAGFLVVALRHEDRSRPEHRPAALWSTVEDPGISADTIAALGRPAALEPLFERTLRPVVRSFLAGGQP